MRLLLLLFITGIMAWANVGKIIYIKGDVLLVRDGKQQPATVGGTLKEKDTILTQTKSITRLLFEDNTSITIGSNSNFSIENYLFDEAKNDMRADFKIKKGIFRTITGKISKLNPNKFKLKTKTATMGIRGTTFSGMIDDDMERIFCEKGSIYVSSQNVTYTIQAGYKTSFKPGHPPAKPQKYKAKELFKIHDETKTWKDKQCDSGEITTE